MATVVHIFLYLHLLQLLPLRDGICFSTLRIWSSVLFWPIDCCRSDDYASSKPQLDASAHSLEPLELPWEQAWASLLEGEIQLPAIPDKTILDLSTPNQPTSRPQVHEPSQDQPSLVQNSRAMLPTRRFISNNKWFGFKPLRLRMVYYAAVANSHIQQYSTN